LTAAFCRLAVILLVMAAASHRQGQNPFVIGPNVQISVSFGEVHHYETQLAADPEDTAHLLAASYVVNADGSVDNVFYVSFDRGATWARTLRVAVGTDPAVAIGLKGTAFAASIHDVAGADGHSDSFLVVHRSTDGGRSWHESSVKVDSRSVDRNYVTVDDANRRVYVHGYLQAPRDGTGQPARSTFVLYSSADGGRTFDRLIAREGKALGKPKFVPANGVVMADGTFVALVALLDAARLNMFRGRSDAASAPDLDGGPWRDAID
jgi:hypothetical protein